MDIDVHTFRVCNIWFRFYCRRYKIPFIRIHLFKFYDDEKVKQTISKIPSKLLYNTHIHKHHTFIVDEATQEENVFQIQQILLLCDVLFSVVAHHQQKIF